MYILRSKVKLEDAGTTQVLIGLSGPDAARCLESAGVAPPASDMHQADANGARILRLAAERLIIVVPAEEAEQTFTRLVAAGAVKAGTAAWQLAMIRAGLPLITAAVQEEFVAQMLNYEVIGGVNFHKGCYPGQEIVARTQYLGKLKKRMYRVALPAASAAVAGADLYSASFGEQSAGKLVNVAAAGDGSVEALAVMQTSCAETGEVRLGTPDGPLLRFLELPYALS
jgi:folate-binding protein YgfZ